MSCLTLQLNLQDQPIKVPIYISDTIFALVTRVENALTAKLRHENKIKDALLQELLKTVIRQQHALKKLEAAGRNQKDHFQSCQRKPSQTVKKPSKSTSSSMKDRRFKTILESKEKTDGKGLSKRSSTIRSQPKVQSASPVHYSSVPGHIFSSPKIKNQPEPHVDQKPSLELLEAYEIILQKSDSKLKSLLQQRLGLSIGTLKDQRKSLAQSEMTQKMKGKRYKYLDD